MFIFKGNPLCSFRVWLIWGIALGIGIPLFVRLIGGDWIGIAGLLLTLTAVFFGSASWMFYFVISGGRLIIRNHLCFWYRNSFVLTEISKAVIDSTAIDISGLGLRKGRPICLRLFLYPQNPKQFYACTLHGKDWKALKEALEQHNVLVEELLDHGTLIKF